MRNKLITLLIGCLFSCVDHLCAGEIDDFIIDVNSEWSAKNYTNMYHIINSRLLARTNDLAALLLKMNYHVMVEYDLTAAQGMVSLFTNTLSSLDWSSDPAAKTICRGMINEIINPTEAQEYGVVYGLSTNQLDAVHAESPTNHPFAPFIVRIADVQYNQ